MKIAESKSWLRRKQAEFTNNQIYKLTNQIYQFLNNLWAFYAYISSSSTWIIQSFQIFARKRIRTAWLRRLDGEIWQSSQRHLIPQIHTRCRLEKFNFTIFFGKKINSIFSESLGIPNECSAWKCIECYVYMQ